MNDQVNNKPSVGFAGLKEHWKDDLLSGFLVSLLALPLCLGIAFASGVPPMAGLIAAIVGGLLMSYISGSYVTISGPAAGLIVVTLAAVETLGHGDQLMGYKYALAAIVVAGLIQVGLGLFKVGKLSKIFPSATVHGMLAAIGVIIIVKQIFVAIGTKAQVGSFFENIGDIPHALANMNPEIALIAMVSLFILVGHSNISFKPIKLIPAPVWVVIVTIPMAHLFDLFHEHHYNLVGHDYVLGPKYLVHLPENILDGIVFPSFGMIGTGAFWIAVISILLVASIETLVSTSAVDTLDPHKRKSNLNQDLSAMGGGSAISGFLGGLPMISEIVRSSTNITIGGKTQWANFFHGGFLLLFLLFGQPIIEQIPLAALAAILISIGFKLAAPAEFKHVWALGKEQLFIFLTVLITSLATNLILGFAVGILVKLLVHLIDGASLKYIFKTKMNYTPDEDEKIGTLHLHNSVIFSNYLSLKKEIESHYQNDRLVLDFKNVNLIDHTFRTHLKTLREDWEMDGKTIDIINKEHLIPVSDHPLATEKISTKNPSKEIHLSGHQSDLLRLADANEWKYSHEKAVNQNEFEEFLFSLQNKINYVKNLIQGDFEETHFTYGEVFYSNGTASISTEANLPALVISIKYNKVELPVFTIDKEGLLEQIKDTPTLSEIVFKGFPEFSRKFLMVAENEEETRKMFHVGVLKLIESDPNYHIESNGKCILFYRFDQKMDKDSIKQLVKFGKKFVLNMNM